MKTRHIIKLIVGPESGAKRRFNGKTEVHLRGSNKSKFTVDNSENVIAYVRNFDALIRHVLTDCSGLHYDAYLSDEESLQLYLRFA